MSLIKKFLKFTAIAVVILAIGAAVLFAWSRCTNPHNYDTLGDIPAPHGFKKIEAPLGSFAEYTRSLPLKPRGAKVKYYGGKKNARFQSLAAAVLDIPLLSNAEQCADAAMRLRAEHLWHNGQYGKIRFRDVNGKTTAYTGGKSRKAFEKYMRHVFETCSTYSMFTFDTKKKSPADVRPGDVFVFPARNGRLGHAVLVADVATDSQGRKALLIVEGNTPARDIHVLRNPNFLDNPWYIIDPSHPGSSTIEKLFSIKGGNLRTYK